jgi:predicted RNA methylase
MTDFDYQWGNLLGKSVLTNEEDKFECNQKRVKEFLELTGIKPWYKKDSFIKDKNCLDAGCGPGRWTCAMQKLGAKKR